MYLFPSTDAEERLVFLPLCHVAERIGGYYLSHALGSAMNFAESLARSWRRSCRVPVAVYASLEAGCPSRARCPGRPGTTLCESLIYRIEMLGPCRHLVFAVPDNPSGRPP